MNLENIIVCAICLVAIGVVGYFMYTKVTTQNEEMLKLSKRCETIEMMFARPPPPDDLQAMYRGQRTGLAPGLAPGLPPGRAPERPAGQHVPAHRRLVVNEHEGGYERPQPRSSPCDSMCDLKPLHIDANEDELDHIVNAELNKVFEEDKASPKRKKSPSSKKSD